MAIPAVRRAGRAHCVAHTVDAGGVFLTRLLVAGGAIDRFGAKVVVGMLGFKIGVATDAGVGLVDGRGERGGVNKDGNFFSHRIGHGERLVGVTLQAFVVGNGLRPSRELQDQQAQNQQNQTMNTHLHACQIGAGREPGLHRDW